MPKGLEITGDGFRLQEVVSPSDGLGNILRKFQTAGGELRYVIMDVLGNARKALALHLAAAELSLKVTMVRSFHWWVEEISVAEATPEHLTFDLSKLDGSPVSIAEFRGASPVAKQKYTCAGYEGCFLDPPYGLQISDAEARQLLEQLDAELFVDGNMPGAEVYSWSTDCSKYFDAGKEWWGAYFWTVHVPQLNRVVGILASATD